MTPCRTAVNTVGLMKLRVPQEPWNFLTRRVTNSFARRKSTKKRRWVTKSYVRENSGQYAVFVLVLCVIT